jgi:hypothetical protein
MGMDLSSISGAEFRFGKEAWDKILQLAQMNGWLPLGTQRPAHWDDPDMEYPATWGGFYETNEGGIVTTEDAQALAAALSKALDDIPDRLNIPKMVDAGAVSPEKLSNLNRMLLAGGATFLIPNPELNPFEFYGGAEKQKVVDFIAFCKKGGFAIW